MKKTFRASLLSALVGMGALVSHAASFADEVDWPTRPV